MHNVMPYIEILGPPLDSAIKARAVHCLTRSLEEGFSVPVEAITVYFVPVLAENYGHAGEMSYSDDADARVLVKVHAYRRDVALRRRVAQEITDTIEQVCGTQRKRIAVYFFEREQNEVAHAGQLACDAG
jgi:phenylpyruvate tautomerase PptA (4-oxalocrotonate tautomerase family)